MGKAVLALRSTAFAATFYTLSLLCVLTAMLVSVAGERPVIATARLWSRMHRLACRWLLGQKVRVIGQLPREAALLVVKHESMFETIDLLCLFEAPAIAAKRELLDIPLWGLVARRYGLIGLERTAGASALRHLRRAALASVASGRAVALFPEGTRVPHGVRAPLQAGFAGLYKLLKLPVVPVAVDSGRLSPRNSFLKRPGTITYLIGDTIPAGLPRAEAEARVLAAINALNPPPG